MAYICVDRGTDKCPCILMEVGQCYTCSMIREGKCNCPADWQGVCPYTEYQQAGGKIINQRTLQSFIVVDSKAFSDNLKVVVLETPLGFALKCKKTGTFLMVEQEGFKVPLSVLRSDLKGDRGYIHLAFYVTGPKTTALDVRSEKGESWNITGPFYNGLTNSEAFDQQNLSLVLGKGIAVMPLINQREKLWGNLAEMYIDTEKLPQAFLSEYMGDVEYKVADLADNLQQTIENLDKAYNYCLSTTEKKPNIFLMVSPYYVNSILEKSHFPMDCIIFPNHSNMCCGEGVCGACSFTDKEGITVRGCKCNDVII